MHLAIVPNSISKVLHKLAKNPKLHQQRAMKMTQFCDLASPARLLTSELGSTACPYLINWPQSGPRGSYTLILLKEAVARTFFCLWVHSKLHQRSFGVNVILVVLMFVVTSLMFVTISPSDSLFSPFTLSFIFSYFRLLTVLQSFQNSHTCMCKYTRAGRMSYQ